MKNHKWVIYKKDRTGVIMYVEKNIHNYTYNILDACLFSTRREARLNLGLFQERVGKVKIKYELVK